MSDHELTEDDHEINVLDTDSRLSHSDSDPRSSRSHCSSPENVSTPNTTLPFSISNLLGKNFEQKAEIGDPGLLYPSSGLFQQRGALGLMPAGFYGQGVLRVPAHRPLGPPGSPSAVFNPWTLGLDPVLQRSAAAAAFASQVVKDRLAESKDIPNLLNLEVEVRLEVDKKMLCRNEKQLRILNYV
ncbi:hypothetical protein HHI36_007185 [Cryptolaemus montrouzieri]|uniref:Uncharacterized protein n=1 Tax=Cryptolaemus montrouzieri TaxID=559131 RepID=A0ABD2MNU1_9CUCU